MKKSILVGIIALGLTACAEKVEDQPTDAVTAEAPAAEAAPAADAAVEAAPAADAGAPVEAPAAQ